MKHVTTRMTLTRHRRQNGQAFLEYLAMVGLAIAALVGLVASFGNGLLDLFSATSTQSDTPAEMVYAMVPEQEEPAPRRIYGLAGTGPISTLPGGGISGGIGGGSGGSGGGGGGSGGGGGGGGSGSSGGGGISGGGPAIPPGNPLEIEVAPGIFATTPTADERRLILGALTSLLRLQVAFDLMNFTTGQVESHPVPQAISAIGRNGVPMLVGDLSSASALAAVFANANIDGTFARGLPVYMVFDRAALALATVEFTASVMMHEGWHVNQFYGGIHDDFVNFPRDVDIEYEAFIAGDSVWQAVKGIQTDSTLDAAGDCVASGEARCKEILASDFGYSTEPRYHAPST